MNKYKLINLSKNRKTGDMPAVYGTRQSCPISCGLYNACYGKQGMTALHWAKDDDKDFDDLITWIDKLNANIWRFGVVGDFPSINATTLDREKISRMARANNKRTMLAYSHFPLNKENIETLQMANSNGLTINASCDSLDDVKKARANGIPAVTYTKHNDNRKSWKNDGIQFVTCPNQSSDKRPTCRDCKLCAIGSRGSVVVFRGHGSFSKRVESVV